MTTKNSSSQKYQQITSYLVGGAVRDQLLNRQVIERDYVVVGATVEQMLALGFQQVGKDFPVFLHPETKDEYALARTEKKQGQGYTGFVCHAEPNVSLAQDLLRRDLTVNAMALTDSGEIIDPYSGQIDLKNKLLRHVSPAFSEDPLRVLRVARFAARYEYLGFTVCSTTLQLMNEISQSGELKALSIERILKEMERSLSEQSPEVFFDILYHCTALKEIWPELVSVWQVQGKMRLMQTTPLTSQIRIRFASLILAIHRGLVTQDHTQVTQMLTRLKFANETKLLAIKSVELTSTCHQVFDLTAEAILALFDKIDLWRKPELLTDLLLVAKVDFQNIPENKNTQDRAVNSYPQAEFLSNLSTQVRAITATTFVERGLKGLAIKEALVHARLVKIEEIKKSFS